MAKNNIELWVAPSTSLALDTVSDPHTITSFAIQLRERERNQIAMNFQAANYEMASSFVWMRSMALLKKQFSSLGAEFIGELLQRPDIDEFSDLSIAISDNEAISLARDLGIITPTQTMRLLQSQQTVSHFATIDNGEQSDQNEVMTQEEAISCLRVCVQGVLGHEQISVAEDFKIFREKLTSETLKDNSTEIIKLISSPYFFLRTAISILLSLFKTTKGAQLEHSARNALLIIPLFWPKLKEPERWQIGQAYAVEFSEGRNDSVKGLHAVLLAVSGFDYVPENLRSTTFVQIANNVISAHEGMNNFYNEASPIKELANLGTSIPGPALASCITATLCIKLGNAYGTSWAAQPWVNQIIDNLTKDRWIYYINGRLENDRRILTKLMYESPILNWINLINELGINEKDAHGKDIKSLISATIKKDSGKIRSTAKHLLSVSLDEGK